MPGRPPYIPPHVPYHPNPNSYRPNEPYETAPFPHPEAYQTWLQQSSYSPSQIPVTPQSYRWADQGAGWQGQSQDNRTAPSRERSYDAGPSTASSYRGPVRGAQTGGATYADRYAATMSSSNQPGPQRSMHTSSIPNFPPKTSYQSLPPKPGLPAPRSPAPSAYTAPHLRAQSPPTTSREPSSARSRQSSAPPPTPPVIPLPSAEYITLSSEPLLPDRAGDNRHWEVIGAEFEPKLLVLDLNGALVYRTARTGPNRTSYPRPYLDCFLEYLFTPEPDDATKSAQSGALDRARGEGQARTRPWEVFVWSSAQPGNVRKMVEVCFGRKWTEGIWDEEDGDKKEERVKRGEGRLLGVWSRDKMGLSESDYYRKTQTTKDLRKVLAHLASSATAPDLPRPAYSFTERNVVLLDDSPLKAINQPFNQIVIPEFDKAQWQASKAAAANFALSEKHSKKSEKANGKEDERTEPASGSVPAESFEDQDMDLTLLAVIGILEAMRHVNNIPAWIRSGNLMPDFLDPPGEGDEPFDLTQEVLLEDLPSHSAFRHWYTDHEILKYWVGRGESALERKGIEVRPGIDQEGHSLNPDRDPEAGNKYYPSVYVGEGSAQSNGAASPRREVRKERGWSPSRPSSPTLAAPRYDLREKKTLILAPAGTGRTEKQGISTMPTDVADDRGDQRGGEAQRTAVTPPMSKGTATVSVSLPPARGSGGRGHVVAGPRGDRWRTFRACDVKAYLQDVADRASLLSAEQREALLRSINTLEEIGLDRTMEVDEHEDDEGETRVHNKCLSTTEGYRNVQKLNEKRNEEAERQVMRKGKRSKRAAEGGTAKKHGNDVRSGPIIGVSGDNVAETSAQILRGEAGIGSSFERSKGRSIKDALVAESLDVEKSLSGLDGVPAALDRRRQHWMRTLKMMRDKLEKVKPGQVGVMAREGKLRAAIAEGKKIMEAKLAFDSRDTGFELQYAASADVNKSMASARADALLLISVFEERADNEWSDDWRDCVLSLKQRLRSMETCQPKGRHRNGSLRDKVIWLEKGMVSARRVLRELTEREASGSRENSKKRRREDMEFVLE